jgi:hypothetical protein
VDLREKEGEETKHLLLLPLIDNITSEDNEQQSNEAPVDTHTNELPEVILVENDDVLVERSSALVSLEVNEFPTMHQSTASDEAVDDAEAVFRDPVFCCTSHGSIRIFPQGRFSSFSRNEDRGFRCVASYLLIKAILVVKSDY